MSWVNHSAFLKALGWSLVDSLWQMGILWLVYVFLTANGKRFSASVRHTLALFSLSVGFSWFLVNLIFRFNTSLQSSISPVGETVSGPANAVQSIYPVLDIALPLLSAAYLAAILFLFSRLLIQYRRTKLLYTHSFTRINPQLRVFTQTIAGRMGIRQEVRIWLSDIVDTPLTIGFLKPVILLPIAAINQLSLSQAESIILHELHHIQRNDYLINLYIAIADIILFFNPFTRVFSEIIKKERENSCDDMVLQFNYCSTEYASALLMLEKNRSVLNTVALAATGRSRGFLLNRVKRILTKQTSATPLNQRMIACVFVFGLLGFIGYFNPGSKLREKGNSDYLVSIIPGGDLQPILEPAVTLRQLPELPPLARTDYEMPQQTNTPIIEEIIYEEIAIDETDSNDEIKILYQPAPRPSFANADIALREYSIADQQVKVKLTENSNVVYPYIPSKSFSYYRVEDTSRPKKYIPTNAELEAKKAMEKALLALQEIDWLKIEKEIKSTGEKVDILKLKEELAKAMAEIDWKKINSELASELEELQKELSLAGNQLRLELQNHQKESAIRAEKLNQSRRAVIEDRLRMSEKTDQIAPSQTPLKRKKIVHI